MTEKSDLPSDQVSLPPNYAPSETFTDSPPPAYKRPGMAAVRVARIVCFTLLAMTFIIGFFVVTHKWVQNRDCKCSVNDSQFAQHAALFAQAPSILEANLDNNKIEENILNKEEIPLLIKEEDNIPEELTVEAKEEESEEENQLVEEVQEELKEVNKDVHLPKDLLLGNPQMAGKNVHCKVEKRQRKIAEGIMTQAIIVTCDDEEDDDDEAPKVNLPVRPPMSLLSSIMKVLSARPRSMGDNQREEPRLFPFPGAPVQRPIPMLQPIRGPFPGGMPSPFPGPFPGPGQVSPIFVPLRKIQIRPFPQQENEESSNNFPRLQQGPPQLIRNEERGPRMFMRPMMHGPRPPMPFIQAPEENNENRLPFPLPQGAFPIRVIRLPNREEPEEEDNQMRFQEDQNEGPFPAPFHPMLKMFPTRRRIIRLRPKQDLDNSQQESLPFPFLRGALPPHRHSDEPPMPHPVPEASGRALPSPVALPGVRVLRLPFRPQEPQPFPEAQVITHMEVRQHPEETNESQEPTIMPFQPPTAPENQRFRDNNKEFGPPKIHTVIENAPRPIAEREDQTEESPQPFHEEPITQTQSQPRFVAPPPPRYAREGRTSLRARLNPDAEVIPTNWKEGPNSQESSIHRIVLN